MESKKIKCSIPFCSFEAETIEEYLQHLKTHSLVDYSGEFWSTQKAIDTKWKPSTEKIDKKFREALKQIMERDAPIVVQSDSLSRVRLDRLSNRQSENEDYTDAVKPSPPPIPKRTPVPTETEETRIKKLLEKGEYEKALGLDDKSGTGAIKSKIIEIRENYPSLSILLIEAEDALLKNRQEYNKNLNAKKDITRQVSKRYGVVAIELFPGDMLWRLIKDKVMPIDELTSHVIQQIEEISTKLPSLNKKIGGDGSAFFIEKDCPVCKGTPPDCPECSGSGKKTRYIRGDDVFKEAQSNPELKKFLRKKRIFKTSIGRSLLEMIFGPVYVDQLLGIRQPEVTMTDPCPLCHGSGKYCSCIYNVKFVVPTNTRPGAIVKGKDSETGKTFYARLGK